MAISTPHHQFIPDDVSLLDDTVVRFRHLSGHRQLTDIYLLALAVAHDAQLVTLDTHIPLNAVHGPSKTTWLQSNTPIPAPRPQQAPRTGHLSTDPRVCGHLELSGAGETAAQSFLANRCLIPMWGGGHMDPAVFGYIRVSQAGGESGLATQRRIFTDVASGRNMRRPAWKQPPGKAPTRRRRSDPPDRTARSFHLVELFHFSHLQQCVSRTSAESLRMMPPLSGGSVPSCYFRPFLTCY